MNIQCVSGSVPSSRNPIVNQAKSLLSRKLNLVANVEGILQKSPDFLDTNEVPLTLMLEFGKMLFVSNLHNL